MRPLRSARPVRSLRAGLLVVLAALSIGAAALAGLLWFGLENTPLVVRDSRITPDDVGQALRLLQAHNPRRAIPGVPRTLVLTEREVELLLNQATNRVVASSSHVVLLRGRLAWQASIELPPNPFGRWLNVDLWGAETDTLPVVERLRIGRLALPAALADALLRALAARVDARAQALLDGSLVKRVMVGERRLALVYEWRSDSAERLRGALVSPAEQERIKAYSDRLAEVSTGAAEARSLAVVLRPLFERVQERTDAGGDAALENRAALLVLAWHANRLDLSTLVPAARSWAQPLPQHITLAGRDDTPLHYLVSAVLAAAAGSPLADAVGLYKELADARGGSGFSFNDLAADRAGTRLGTLAIQAPRKLQVALAAGPSESDLLPAIADLPESLPEAEFVRRYGGVGAPAYQRMLADIDARIATTPLLR